MVVSRHLSRLDSQTNETHKNLSNLLFAKSLSTEFWKNTVVSYDAE